MIRPVYSVARRRAAGFAGPVSARRKHDLLHERISQSPVEQLVSNPLRRRVDRNAKPSTALKRSRVLWEKLGGVVGIEDIPEASGVFGEEVLTLQVERAERRCPNILRVDGCGEEPFQPRGVERDIVVQDSDPLRIGCGDPSIHGDGETVVAVQADDVRTRLLGQIGRTIGGTIIDHEDLIEGPCLKLQIVEQGAQQRCAIPVRNDCGHLHEKRFCTRNHKFAKPSRHGFSLISPKRELY